MPSDVVVSLMELDQRVITDKVSTESEFEFTHRNGETSILHAYKFPVLNQQNEVIGVGGISADVTDSKQLEESLRQAQKMEAVGQLTGGVAHDFNNLLAVTLANAQMLQLALAESKEERAMAGYIVKASQRGAELTHRLLAFSRQPTLLPKTLCLIELCLWMDELLKRSLGETIEIEIDIGSHRAAWNVMADPGQVENAMLNLVINASHAMSGGGTVSVGIENAIVTNQDWAKRWEGRPGKYVELRVSDTGTGIPAHALTDVFNPLYTTKGVGQGSGLGLGMVYGLARQSDGFATIESKEGEGTQVSIYLPRAKLKTAVENAPEHKGEILRGRGEIILLVEDETAVRKATTSLLKKLGYNVLVAEDRAGAMELISTDRQVDMLLSDMVLPGGMNGIDIINRIHEQRPALKCLFMSGYAELPDQMLPKDAEILPKPVDMVLLAAKTRAVLDA